MKKENKVICRDVGLGAFAIGFGAFFIWKAMYDRGLF